MHKVKHKNDQHHLDSELVMESILVQTTTQDTDKHVENFKEIPFSITCKVNGKTIQFKIDTGDDVTYFERELVETLGLPILPTKLKYLS